MRSVNPNFYTQKYYLNDCSGYEQYKRSWGKVLEPRFMEIVKRIPNINNLSVLDIGCGRGELVFWSSINGAKNVVGIDYSKQAIKLAKEASMHYTKKVRDKIMFYTLDAKNSLSLNMKFDVVIITEVVEHLYPEELTVVFKNIYKMLNKNGFIFVHTAPNKWFNDFTYKYWCYPIGNIIINVSNALTGHSYGNLDKPSNIRSEIHKLMHVNEPTYFSLSNLFKSNGFKGKILSTNITINKPILSWKDQVFNFIVYLSPLSYFPPLNIFWGNDFITILRRIG